MSRIARDSNMSWIGPWLLVVLAIATAAVITYPEKFTPVFPVALVILESFTLIKG